MSKKTLNHKNLERLGPEKLAALVMELVQGNAALQRRARSRSIRVSEVGDIRCVNKATIWKMTEQPNPGSRKPITAALKTIFQCLETLET
jgi:hypothetical protein